MAVSKLTLFDEVDFDFKIVHGHALKASVLIPKSLQSTPRKKYPVIVNWHGGGFVVGERLYEGWLPIWLLNICLTEPAIFVAPDYRLLPEASPGEILDDVEDFWKWLHQKLPSLLETSNAVPDLDRLACTGQSAGGYLAIQSAILFSKISQVKVVISMAGGLNSNVPQLRIPGPKVILGKKPPPPGKAESIVRAYVKSIKPGAVRTSGDVVEMWDFLTCVIQQAYLARWLGKTDREDFDAMKALEQATVVPPVWFIHGEQDSMVPSECTLSFVEAVKRTHPEVPVLVSFQPGDHGFEASCDGKEEWIQEGCTFFRRYWS